MSFGKPPNFTRTVAFRLTIWYAAIFTGSMLVAFVIFYLVLMNGVHHVVISPRSLHELLEAYSTFFGYALGVIAFGSILVGWLLAQRALTGVKTVTYTAVSIAGHDLGRRVPIKDTDDEIDQLAVAFNDMLERIEMVLQSMKEITDNIAHDLRSPITRMRGVAEMALINEASNEGYTAMAGTVVEECDRLLGMINTMLDISQAEAGLTKIDWQEIDLVTLLCDVRELFEPVADDRRISLLTDVPESLVISGDRSKLQRVFANLLDNALKYTLPKGTVKLSVSADSAFAEITIEDNGLGIAEDELPRVFDRFFRGEKSRSAPGNGLGLSLACAFVHIHGGTLTVTSHVGKGSRFTVRLPIQPQALDHCAVY